MLLSCSPSSLHPAHLAFQSQLLLHNLPAQHLGAQLRVHVVQHDVERHAVVVAALTLLHQPRLQLLHRPLATRHVDLQLEHLLILAKG